MILWRISSYIFFKSDPRNFLLSFTPIFREDYLQPPESQEVLESNESLSMGAHHMRDGVSIAHQRRLQPIVSASEIMELNKLEAYVSLPGNYPVAKLTFAIVM